MEHLTLIQLIIVWILPILFAITVHEAAHGFAAYFFGDKTAFLLGRLTLNPIKHIDLIGTIIVPLTLLFLSRLFGSGGFIFGWAKPVPISSGNLKKPRLDLALIALAGPASNIIMLILWAFIAKLGFILVHQGFNWSLAIFYMGIAGIMINSLLAILNLLPIPPLDGGHVLMGLLPKSWARGLHHIEPYGLFILLLLIMTDLLRYIIEPPIYLLQKAIFSLFGL
jgi:Zn-dependent protease